MGLLEVTSGATPAAARVALLLLAAMATYAVLGGADFGGGVWDLLARGPRRHEQRQAIARAMGPVWEANHVWLIFLLVVLFTAFPAVFSALSVALFAPFHLVLLGIVLRGAAFVFRSPGAAAAGPQRAWGTVFGAASAITPVLLGMSLAAVSDGSIRVGAGGAVTSPSLIDLFTRPLPLAMGALALALSAYLAAVYLTVETSGPVQEDFRRRALATGAVLATLALALLPLLRRDAPHLWEELTHRQALPLLLAGAMLAAGSTLEVWSRRYASARVLAVGEVLVLLAGWGFAQWPYLIYPDLTVANSAAPATSLDVVLRTVSFGLLILLPSLWLLFMVFKGENPAGGSPAGGNQTS